MKTDGSRFDYSTLDAAALRRLPVWKPAPTYTLQTDPGNGCYGDPPGYPTYFTRSVYTQNGNSPSRGTTQVICFDGVNYATMSADEDFDKHYVPRLRRLYKPLAESHPRVQAWIVSQYIHSAHCYRDPGPYHVGPVTKNSWERGTYGSGCRQVVTQLDPGGQRFDKCEDAQAFVKSFDEWAHADIVGVEKADFGRSPAMLIYPVPDYHLRTFHDDPRFSRQWRKKEQATIAQANKEIEARYARVCIPENHQAFLAVRKFYPDHQVPVREVLNGAGQMMSYSYIEVPPVDRVGDWWEREATCPSPRNCPGSYGRKHEKGKWCQYCGQKGEEVKA